MLSSYSHASRKAIANSRNQAFCVVHICIGADTYEDWPLDEAFAHGFSESDIVAVYEDGERTDV